MYMRSVDTLPPGSAGGDGAVDELPETTSEKSGLSGSMGMESSLPDGSGCEEAPSRRLLAIESMPVSGGASTTRRLLFPVRPEHDLHRPPVVEQLHRLVELLQALELVGDEVLDVEAGAEEVEHLDPGVEDAAADDGVHRQALEHEVVGVVPERDALFAGNAEHRQDRAAPR